jgi:hypothetical protein
MLSFIKHWNNKFYYKAGSCWYFYWVHYNCVYSLWETVGGITFVPNLAYLLQCAIVCNFLRIVYIIHIFPYASQVSASDTDYIPGFHGRWIYTPEYIYIPVTYLKRKFTLRVAYLFYKIHTICWIVLNIPSVVKCIKLINVMCSVYVKPVIVYCVSVPFMLCSYHKLYCMSNKWPTQERHSY